MICYRFRAGLNWGRKGRCDRFRQSCPPRRRQFSAPMTQGSGSLLVQAVDAVFADAGGASIHALQQVSAEFLPGQLSVIVGPSGSGKSTLLHALAGIVLPQRGLISFGPTVVNQLDERRRDAWRLAHCGLLFQEFRLIEELDALANVLLPAQFNKPKWQPGCASAAVSCSNVLTCRGVPYRWRRCRAANSSVWRWRVHCC